MTMNTTSAASRSTGSIDERDMPAIIPFDPSHETAAMWVAADEIDRQIALLDAIDGDADFEDGGDLEEVCEDEGAQCDDEGDVEQDALVNPVEPEALS